MWISESYKGQYINIVKRALADSKIFNCFKAQPPFSSMVGVSDPFHAMSCYATVVKNEEVKKNLIEFGRNDLYGAPLKVPFNEGKFGTDTMRFAESVCYIQKHFGDLNGKRVVEFGSNYGGLAYLILTQWKNVSTYHLIDLPDVQLLSVKYLKELGISDNITIEQPTSPADVFISEYAITEHSDDDLYAYYEQYAKPSILGVYFRMNIFQPEREKKFIATMKKDFKQVIVVDEIKSRNPNKVVIATK